MRRPGPSDAATLALVNVYETGHALRDALFESGSEYRKAIETAFAGYSDWWSRTLLPPEVRTSDFSDRLEQRDRLLEPGCEAQWCIFDPVLSVTWGRRYLATGDESDLEQQTRHFNRALSQLTADGQCPELYYMRDARTREYAPNDHVPLAWTQANLGCALLYMERAAARTASP